MIAEIREIFSLFDKDADGFVETSQLGTIIRGLNMNPSEAEVAEMVKDVDPDGRGTFNQNALCSLIARRPKQEDTLEDMAESLKILCNARGSLCYCRTHRVIFSFFLLHVHLLLLPSHFPPLAISIP